MAWISAALGIVRGAIEWLVGRQRREARAEAERTGAIKQKLADAEAREKVKDDQLESAVNRRPGDASERLRRGDF